VRDLAGFLFGDRVVAGALVRGQRPEGAGGELVAEWKGEPRGPQGVTAEQREVPGAAGRAVQIPLVGEQ
jgi:hypothetical protein